MFDHTVVNKLLLLLLLYHVFNYTLGKNAIVRRSKISHFLVFSAFFGIWCSAGAFFALRAMWAHFFRFLQHIFCKIAPRRVSVILTHHSSL